MEDRTLTVDRVGTIRAGMTIADLKLKVAEHIIAQNGSRKPDEVYRILVETKVGAWRRQTLLEKLRMVFATS